MQKNEGTVDRVVRLVAGIGLGMFAYTSLSGWGQIILYVIAGVLLFTSLTGVCMLYRLIGISTCPVDTKAGKK